MAIFTFECEEHGEFTVGLPKGTSEIPCKICKAPSYRILKSGTIVVKEVIDNGLMVRSIERPVNVEELAEERIAIHEKKLREG